MTFSLVADETTGCCQEAFFGCWGHDLVSFAISEKFKQESMYGLLARTKKSCRYREVAISGGSRLDCIKFQRTGLELEQIILWGVGWGGC